MELSEKQIKYIDLPEMAEIFADSVGFISFDGQSARLELCVTRLDRPNPAQPATAKRYPACRLVLTPNAVLNLFNQLQNIINALQQQGIIQKVDTPQAGPKH